MTAPELAVETTSIPGLLVVRLPLHEDARGWFKENWQRAKMTALGLPDFGPVQNNVSFNASRGAIRGLHAEPWDKFVSVACGRVFAAWVDLREGESFGRTFWLESGPDVAVFVPGGVANSYQALEDGTVYSYLVNEHWRPGKPYPAANVADPAMAIPWPIPLDSAGVELSDKDRSNPLLADVVPMKPKPTLVLGGGGQLGRALAAAWPEATVFTRAELDLTDPAALAAVDWTAYGTVINAAAYTAVDAAEAPEGRVAAWAVNATGPALLAWAAREYGFTLVHYSSDYVFDGVAPMHSETEPLAPLGVYGQSKAAGDLAVANAPRHYLLRTSWVVGDGANFVRTMQRLAGDGVSPTVVDDQIGRLTFTSTLAAATRHLLETRAPYGTYHVSNSGEPLSWRAIAAEVFARSGRERSDVAATTTTEYAAGRVPFAPRPLHSTLDLTKLEATGFRPEPQLEALDRYLRR